MQKVEYQKLRAELIHYAAPEEGETFSLEEFTDGILERLVIAGLIDPEKVEGWPDDGMVLPLLGEMRGSA